MKQLTVFRLVRDPRNNDRILRKKTLRIINVHPVFVGIGERGVVNKAEFKKLADALEPSNDGFTIL